MKAINDTSITRNPLVSGQIGANRKSTDIALVETAEILSDWAKSFIRLRTKWTIFKALTHCYTNPLDWVRGLWYLARRRQAIFGNNKVRKIVRINNLYYTDLYIPGWNDAVFQNFVTTELSHLKPHDQRTNQFNQVFIAITKKCPLRCEHCSAWDTLNLKDHLGIDDFTEIIRRIDQMGFSQIYFTGGEPLIKFQLLETLIAELPIHVKSWIATSGFQLTREKARRLKESGLTGLFISLDHYDEEEHNAFRNHKDAYSWALKASRNALEAGLVVAFSVCLNDDLCQKKELFKYMSLARDCGVHFVQFLEPQSVGHYRGRQVSLSGPAIASVETFYLEMNFSKKYLDFPLIHYIGYYHRRIGCFGGKQVVYIDADGNLNSCPFCHENYGNLLEGEVFEKVKAMANSGCSLYGSVERV